MPNGNPGLLARVADPWHVPRSDSAFPMSTADCQFEEDDLRARACRCPIDRCLPAADRG